MFPIPKLPPPRPTPKPTKADSSNDDAADDDKENAPAPPEESKEAAPTELKEGELPPQIQDMLSAITSHIKRFETSPPHTIQRLAELVLSPRAHYKALVAYLHAVDRVVLVTSGTDTYPLPPAIPDMSTLENGDEAANSNPADAVSWGNTANNTVGSDEALGGALLTPIPWLTKREDDSATGGSGAQIHSEGTQTIDGPNGMGSIETVSVSINGVASTGHARGVTQGELLRQEQRAGVVPVSQLRESYPEEEEEEEEEVEHARGPEEIGMSDTGPQGQTTSVVGEGGGVETQGIDVAAALGRNREEEMVAKDKDDAVMLEGEETAGTKREGDELQADTPKKVKEDEGDTKEAGEEKKDGDGEGKKEDAMEDA